MRIAIAQIPPVFLDRDATIARVAAAVDEAGAKGCTLVAFGEAFVPGYPIWLCRTDGARFEDPAQKAMHAAYVAQGVSIEDGHLEPVVEAACRHGITVVLGIVERPRDRGGHSLFCSRVVIGPQTGLQTEPGAGPTGGVVSVHRKLMPTYEERLCWGVGDGAGLTVHSVGPFTMGALNCWENWMPLARAALYAQGVDLHVAIWPGRASNTREITRFIAMESRSYVVSASAVLTPRDIPESVPMRERMLGDPEQPVAYDGGSCIAGPDGAWLVEPVCATEGLIIADLDHTRVLAERQTFDPAGHYSRPDVLRLTVSRQRQRAARFEG
ncbi:MAG: carbon-nitrogen hydrolase family protein [Phycisphaerales bacterium]|nr:carbon-nitrogen hydrolase family protein [Phycisphaerales bacterium]